MCTAFLVLDDGRTFEGKSWGAQGRTFGEAVFQTGMTGYQETLTDPSYHKQVVIMTAPHIGNTGFNSHDNESEKIWVSGFVVRNPSQLVSNWRSENDLESELVSQNIVGLQGIDTRALTRHLRDRGAMRVGIFSGLDLTREEMVIEVRKSSQMSGSFLVAAGLQAMDSKAAMPSAAGLLCVSLAQQNCRNRQFRRLLIAAMIKL